jgi:hypothetical protein
MGRHAVSAAVDETNSIAQLGPYLNNLISIFLAEPQLLLRHLMMRI